MYPFWSESFGLNGPIHYFLIPNFEGAYIIGDDGSLWTRRQKVGWHWVLSDDWTRRNLSKTDSGHLSVYLNFKGIKYHRYIHQLVCEAVYGPCPAGEEVCHNDNDPSHNDWWNLRYDTRQGNHADKVIHGTILVGDKNPSAKKTWNEVREIREKYFTGKYTQKDLALEYDVSEGIVWSIVNNLTWVE